MKVLKKWKYFKILPVEFSNSVLKVTEHSITTILNLFHSLGLFNRPQIDVFFLVFFCCSVFVFLFFPEITFWHSMLIVSIILKEINFCDFLIAILHTKPLLKVV